MKTKFIYLIMVLIYGNVLYAHQPDLASLMIYNQNGKYLLVVKSSLTAFESEIDYHFAKNAYKTPEEFQQLVVKYFQKNCFVIINNDTIKLVNPSVIIGHETTVFAELAFNNSTTIKSLYIKNTLFKDMPGNMCELIIATEGQAQKQHVLATGNNHEVKLRVENETWVIEEAKNYSSKASTLVFWVAFFSLIVMVVMIAQRRKKQWPMFHSLR